MSLLKTAALAATAVSIAACTAVTSISAVQPGASVTITSSKSTEIPRTETYSTTSFGNYEFRADAPGLEPFFGVLPLKFNGGYLALDILFFAPAAFFNLREVYAFYEFDVAKKQLKFKRTEQEEWNIHIPLEIDVTHSKATLGTKQ